MRSVNRACSSTKTERRATDQRSPVQRRTPRRLFPHVLGHDRALNTAWHAWISLRQRARPIHLLVLKCVGKGVDLTDGRTLRPQHLAPTFAHDSSQLRCHPFGIRSLDIEQPRRLKGEHQRGFERLTLQDAGLKHALTGWCRIDIERWRETPAVAAGIDEPMVLQVIIRIRHQHCEHDPTPEFMKIFARLTGNLSNHVSDIRVVTTFRAIPIQSRPRRHVRNTNMAAAVKSADQRHRAIAPNEFETGFRNAQAAPCGKP